jgi:U3 small nucleolar RNA-associated protein 4
MDTVQSQLSRKRKRHPHEADPEDRELRKNTSGAGSKIPDQILGTGMSRQVQRYVVGEVDEISEIRRKAGDVETGDMSMDVDSTMVDFENFDEEDDAEDNHGALGVSLVRNGEDARKEEEEARTAWQRPPHWWHTYKYRPILGIVALDGPSVDGEGGEEEEAIGPEVVLVERPGWESDLPARYYGKQEWEKGGI